MFLSCSFAFPWMHWRNKREKICTSFLWNEKSHYQHYNVPTDFFPPTGGYDGNDFLSSVECYDIEKDRWTECTSMSCGRSGHGAATAVEPCIKWLQADIQSFTSHPTHSQKCSLHSVWLWVPLHWSQWFLLWYMDLMPLVWRDHSLLQCSFFVWVEFSNSSRYEFIMFEFQISLGHWSQHRLCLSMLIYLFFFLHMPSAWIWEHVICFSSKSPVVCFSC